MINSYLINVKQEGQPDIQIVGNILNDKLTAVGPTTVYSSFEIRDNALVQTYFGFVNGNFISGTATLKRLLG